MVRDIFGVPISTVPSDSAFSTSGRVLDSFRSSLSPSIVEALICSADWFRSANASFQDAVDLEDLTELEDGPCLSYIFFPYLSHHTKQLTPIFFVCSCSCLCCGY
ncbi:Putative AC transposase [Linum perenne]